MVFLYDLTMPELLRRILSALIYAGLQGGLLALALRILGDRRAKDDGRGGFNPFNHVLLSGIFLTIAFRQGWIKAPPYAPASRPWERLRPLSAVVLSFAVLLALVPLLDLARSPLHQMLPRGPGYWVLSTIDTLQYVLVGSVALALLPFPGLLVGSTLPVIWPALQRRFTKLAGIGMAAAAILVILGWFPDWTPVVKLLRIV